MQTEIKDIKEMAEKLSDFISGKDYQYAIGKEAVQMTDILLTKEDEIKSAIVIEKKRLEEELAVVQSQLKNIKKFESITESKIPDMWNYYMRKG